MIKNTVAIGTVGGSPKRIEDRHRFETGLNEMALQLKPTAILVYGSANHPCFEELKKEGIRIIQYPSETSQYYERRKNNE